MNEGSNYLTKNELIRYKLKVKEHLQSPGRWSYGKLRSVLHSPRWLATCFPAIEEGLLEEGAASSAPAPLSLTSALLCTRISPVSLRASF